MYIKELLHNVQHSASQDLLEMRVTGVKEHVDHVQQGNLFLVLPSAAGHDMHEVARNAAKKGAVALVAEPHVCQDLAKESLPAKLIPVSDVREARARIAARCFPHQPRHVVAVTGTNGKTSTVEFFRQICTLMDKPAASIGTLGIHGTAPWIQEISSALTSPAPFFLHQVLDRLARDNVDYVAMEASSHGIHQKRLEAVNFQAAAFTNLSHDHLDYHGNVEAYFEAKKRLFSQVLGEGLTAIVNADDVNAPELMRLCEKRHERVFSYGKNGKEIKLEEVFLTENGQVISLEFFGRRYKLDFPLVGLFQVMNALCASGLACAVGLSPDDVVQRLASLQSVPGRLQYVGTTRKKGHVYVDYAHTPHALESVLTTLKPHLRGPLVVVFGCGGERDAAKRRAMGEIAGLHAAKVIVTDDNPRSEKPEAIRAAVMEGCPDAHEIGDRRQAIHSALKGLGEHGVCVIAGKGHEQGQLVAGQVIPFDDVKVAQEILVQLKGVVR
jgi:UDP-N-acetylmuramoyl-L-alanyl-D-glutamate--2,6-diaminopimelate ligase